MWPAAVRSEISPSRSSPVRSVTGRRNMTWTGLFWLGICTSPTLVPSKAIRKVLTISSDGIRPTLVCADFPLLTYTLWNRRARGDSATTIFLGPERPLPLRGSEPVLAAYGKNRGAKIPELVGRGASDILE